MVSTRSLQTCVSSVANQRTKNEAKAQRDGEGLRGLTVPPYRRGNGGINGRGP